MFGPTSEAIPLWRVFAWIAVIAAVLLVFIFIFTLWTRGRRATIAMVACALISATAGIGYRIKAEYRYHARHLTETALDLFEPAAGASVRRSNLDTDPLSNCGYPARQTASISQIQHPYDPSHQGEGAVDAIVFDAMNAASTRLEDDGWSVRRFELTNYDTGELEGLMIRADRSHDYLDIVTDGDGERVKTYAAECYARHVGFFTERPDQFVAEFKALD